MKQLVVAAAFSLAALVGPGQSAMAMPLSALVNRLMHTQSGTDTSTGAPVVKVQANEAGRIGQLEEEIRQLNGRIEEMSFQLLQMQEQIRKFQEDNEFRFQDLESGKTTGKKSGALEKPVNGGQPSDQAAVSQPEADSSASADIGTGGDTGLGGELGSTTGKPPANLGSIRFDENGNSIGAEANASLDSGSSLPGVGSGTGSKPPQSSGQSTASLNSPDDIYQSAYAHVLAGDYTVAEQEFRDYLDIYPEGDKAADASFWMGEAQYSQGNFNDAAKTFLNAHQTYGQSKKAPEMLLKLGMSLAALDNKDTACATLKEVGKRYPNASKAVKAKVTAETSRLAC